MLDEVADTSRRREIAGQTTETAERLARDVAKKSTDVGSQLGGKVSDLAHAVSEEGHELMKEHAKARKTKKPRRHRLRNSLVMVGAGAVAGFFLDPKAGAERREALRRRTATSAESVGNNLDWAAHVAHQTAEATTPDPTTNAARSTTGRGVPGP